jgi:hypothetical protein
MPNALTLDDMSPQLRKVVERARRESQGRFHSLAHLIDVPALMRAYQRQRASAAVGVDGITKGQYGQDLVGSLEDLHGRLKAKTYRHQPIRRVHIPKGQGRTRPIGISAFEDKVVQDAVQAVLGKRMARFGLTLHPDKTRLLPFGRPSHRQQSGKGPGAFDFFGFTFYWTRSRRGRWRLGCKTRRSSLRKAKMAISAWCRRHRHLSIQAQHAALCRRLQGHFNYFGVNGNSKRLQELVEAAKSSWFKWLRRRGQRRPLTWKRYEALPRWWPLPRPRVIVQIWGPTSTSHIGGGAGWWKSPSPDLARGRGG